MKCFRYFSFVFFALLGVFFGSFILNQNDTYAETQTVTFLSGSTIPAGNFGFDLSKFTSPPLYLSYSCDPTSNGDRSMYIRYQPGNGSSFVAVCSMQSGGISIVSGSYVLGYIPNGGFGPYNSTTVSGVNSWTFTLSDEAPGGGSTPSGSLEITENGTYDVTDYAEAVVNVPETECPPSSGGDYHQDLVAINNSIMICAATCLVIYFFYCIYRMIIRNSGVK